MAHVTRPARLTLAVRPRPSAQDLTSIRRRLRDIRAERKRTLTQLIEEKGLTMTQVADQTGIDLSYVSRIISGDRMPGLDTTMRLARCLNISLELLANILIPELDLATKFIPNKVVE